MTVGARVVKLVDTADLKSADPKTVVPVRFRFRAPTIRLQNPTKLLIYIQFFGFQCQLLWGTSNRFSPLFPGLDHYLFPKMFPILFPRKEKSNGIF